MKIPLKTQVTPRPVKQKFCLAFGIGIVCLVIYAYMTEIGWRERKIFLLPFLFVSLLLLIEYQRPKIFICTMFFITIYILFYCLIEGDIFQNFCDVILSFASTAFAYCCYEILKLLIEYCREK